MITNSLVFGPARPVSKLTTRLFLGIVLCFSAPIYAYLVFPFLIAVQWFGYDPLSSPASVKICVVGVLLIAMFVFVCKMANALKRSDAKLTDGLTNAYTRVATNAIKRNAARLCELLITATVTAAAVSVRSTTSTADILEPVRNRFLRPPDGPPLSALVIYLRRVFLRHAVTPSAA